MDTVKIDRKNTKMVAHRGVSGLERENTCPAFIAAGNRSYYGVETDIHVGIDGEFIVMHDASTKRVSGGVLDVNVETTPLSDLRDIVLPDRDGSTVRRDIRIPILEEYVSICKKYDKVCVLEIKGNFGRENLTRVTEKIKALDYLDSIIFISFDLKNCTDLRSLLPEAEIQFLTSEFSDGLIDLLIKEKLDLDIHYSALTKDRIDELHNKGIVVNCWTVDDPKTAEQLASWGVDQITSNILE